MSRFIARFYSKPRSKLACYFGSFFVIPLVSLYERNLEKAETSLGRDTAIYGRLKLAERMIIEQVTGGRYGKKK